MWRALGLVLGVFLGSSPGGGGKLEAFSVGDVGLFSLKLGKLVLHVLVVGTDLALLGASSGSSGFLRGHLDGYEGGERKKICEDGWMEGVREGRAALQGEGTAL